MLRGMGVRLWFFFQSVGQLSRCFGDRASIFLDNIDTQQFFGINAIESADLISKRLGDATITTESFQQGTSYSRSSGGGSQQQSGQHSSTHDQQHDQLFRDGSPPDQTGGSDSASRGYGRHLPSKPSPILARLVKYFEAPEFRKRGMATSCALEFDAFITSRFALLAGLMLLAFSITVEDGLQVPSRPNLDWNRRVGPGQFELFGSRDPFLEPVGS